MGTESQLWDQWEANLRSANYKRRVTMNAVRLFSYRRMGVPARLFPILQTDTWTRKASKLTIDTWRVDRSFYFVTWRTKPFSPVLRPDERTCVATTLEHFHEDRYNLSAYVIMDDHVHVLFRMPETLKLQKVVHSWKSFSAREVQKLNYRVGAVWQQEYFDRIIRDERELYAVHRYIENNPTKRWPELTDYPWYRSFAYQE